MYFSSAFTAFFKNLAAHNDRDWFNDNKKIYLKEVKQPFESLVADLIEATGSKLLVKDATFRINRDTRFAKDKTPYKLHVGAVISDGGRKDMQIPGLYVQLSVEEQWMGGGMYMPDKENLFKIRQAIANEPEKWEKLISDKKFVELFGSIKGEKNKILSKDVKALNSDNPWLFNKQFYCMAEYKDEKIPLRKDLLSFILNHQVVASGVNDFLKSAIMK